MEISRDRRQTLEATRVVAVCVMGALGAILAICSIILVIGTFSALGAAYGALLNILWLSCGIFVAFKVVQKVGREFEKEEIFENLSKAEQQALMEKKVEEYRKEMVLESQRRESSMKWGKVRTSKVQGQE